MPDNLERFQLLRTKLYRPRTTDDLIRRPRVRELLECRLDHPLVLVSAPAGFGKTTLLSDWLGRCSTPNAWLSLDTTDSDLRIFLSYFVAAIRTLFPSACPRTLAMLQASALPPVEPLAAALIHDLDCLADEALSAGQDLIVVLDDYHMVAEPSIHALLGRLLQHPPRNLHLVLSTRRDPPLPLHTLRARGALAEIRTEDLRFTPEEAAAFMHQAVGTPLDPEELAGVTERAEGWPTGLRLAALTIGAGLRPSDAVAAAPDDRYAFDYLLNEVLLHLPLATQEFLLATSILDRLSGPLCDAVVPPVDPAWHGRAYLEWLAGQNLFTVALDAQGTWYRYHHLFQRLLRNQLERRHSVAEIAELHRRARDWFAQNGLVEEAIQHAVASGDEMAVVRLVERHRHDAMNHERWGQLERWLRLVPRPLIDASPELLLAEAWILQQQWRAGDLLRSLDRIEPLVEQAASAGAVTESDLTLMRAEIDVLRSWIFYYSLQGAQAQAAGLRALEAAPLEYSMVRGGAWFYYAAGRHMTGDVQGGIDALLEGLKEDRGQDNAFASRLYICLCFLYWMGIDFRALTQAATRLLRLGEERDLVDAVAFGHYFRGCALYQADDLAGAEAEFGAALRYRYLAHAVGFAQSSFGLAAIYQACGASAQALEVTELVAGYALEVRNARLAADVRAFSSLLALESGSSAEARRWAAEYGRDTPVAPMNFFHTPHVTLARIQLCADPPDLAAAASTLARLSELAARTHNTLVRIQSLALHALLFDAEGNRATALDSLKQAVDLAEPSGAIRIFVDLGPKIAALLRRLPARGPGSGYLSRLLDAFEAEQARRAGQVQASQSAQPTPAQHLAEQAALVEPLTQRELEVLELLSERLSNNEIAAELTLSPATVKRHTVNIYQKLAVGSRREAVEAAIALGILTPSPRAGRQRRNG